MSKGPRFESGLPRGGIGYAAIPVAAAALAVAAAAHGRVVLVVPVAALLPAFWLALGLMKDDRAGDATDVLAVENDEWGFWYQISGVWRLSALSMVTAAAALVVGAVRFGA